MSQVTPAKPSIFRAAGAIIAALVLLPAASAPASTDPYLEPAEPSAPAFVLVGESFTVDWRIENHGEAP